MSAEVPVQDELALLREAARRVIDATYAFWDAASEEGGIAEEERTLHELTAALTELDRLITGEQEGEHHGNH